MERRAELALSALVAASMHVAAIGGVSLLARPAATPTSSAGRVHDSRVVLLSSEQLNAILDPTPSAPRPREAAATTHDVELDPLTTATGSGAAPEWTPLPATDEPVRALSLRVVRAPRPAELLTPPAAGCESEVATSSDAAQSSHDAPAAELPPLDASTLLVHRPPLDYPATARRLGMEGTVEVGLEIAADGRVDRVWLLRSSTSSLLDRAALDNVRRWRFDPSTLRSERRFRQSVRFHLR